MDIFMTSKATTKNNENCTPQKITLQPYGMHYPEYLLLHFYMRTPSSSCKVLDESSISHTKITNDTKASHKDKQ